MDVKTKLEFVVSMTCSSCVDAVKKAVANHSKISSCSINLETQQVVVDSELSAGEVKEVLESTGLKAALVGIGSTLSKGHLGAAVVELRGSVIKGVVRLVQLTKDVCLIDGTVDGLSPGQHALNIHTYGDLTKGCESCGDHFNPYGSRHGSPTAANRHVGDLGNIEANNDGKARFRFTDEHVKVYDVIGRSMVIHEKADDFLLEDGNSGKGIACAIIARSSGLFQNSKRFCACDGISIWDERNVPDAGVGRSQKSAM